MLTTALIAVVAYALSPIELGTEPFEVKKISLKALEAKPKVDSVQIKKEAEEKKKKQQTPDTCKQTFLFIGDSMLEGLTHRFDDYAGFNGHTLHTVIWYSSSSEKWGTTKTLEHYIAQYHPTFIVVCLCSNELFVRDLDKRDQYIQSIVKKIGKIPFVWISPPNWKEDTAHPTPKAAAEWFDLVAKWMMSKETAHPIIMKVPDKDYKAASVVIMQPDNPGY